MSDKNQGSIEKESLTKSKTDYTEPTVSEVQKHILESEKINVTSSVNDSVTVFAGKAKYSEETTLIPLKVIYPSS